MDLPGWVLLFVTAAAALTASMPAHRFGRHRRVVTMVFAYPQSEVPPAPAAGDRAGAGPAARQLRCVAVLLALTLAGCSAGTPQQTGTPAAGVTPALSEPPASAATPAPSSAPSSGKTPATAGTPAPTRSAKKLAVTLVRSGGFAGLTETVTVQPDGSWKRGDGRTTNRTGRLTAAQMSRLQTLVADPQLAAEAKRQPPGTNQCNDTFTYQLMVGNQLIKYEECPGQVKPPKVTMEIVAFLQQATAA